jgi:hypothetical protein
MTSFGIPRARVPQYPEAAQFDFLEGEWTAVCRFPRPGATWGEGPGTLKVTRELDRCVFVELFEGPYMGEMIKGLSLRAFNPKTRMWEHSWTDTASPGGFQVWRGRFKDGEISLFGDWTDDSGQRVLSRLTWSRITNDSAHWESHRSLDDGMTWEKHWEIDLTRRTGKRP